MPERWSWEKVGNIFEINPKVIGDDSKNASFIPMEKISAQNKNEFSFEASNWGKIKKNHTQFKDGDVCFAKISPCFENGKAFIAKNLINGIGAGTTELIVLRNDCFDKKYTFYFLANPLFINYCCSTFNGVVGQQRIGTDIIRNYYFPVPPLTEQKLIVAEIEKIFNLIDSIETDKSALQLAVKQAKAKILDLAIHGKLVPQDPADEPASALLEKLRAEKEAKIAKGELKRDKNDSYIYKSTTDNCHYEKFSGKDAVCIEDEIPFEIPDSWQWAKLGRICTKLVDGDHNPPKGIEEKTDYIMASSRNINHDCVEDLKNVRYLTKEMFEIENQRTKAEKGDIFFTSVGTLGRSCIYDGNLNICFQRSVSILKTQIENKYLKYFFDSSFYQDYVLEHATGTAQQGFYLQEMSESYIAIPPINEQKRIVSKIEELFEALDQIQSNFV